MFLFGLACFALQKKLTQRANASIAIITIGMTSVSPSHSRSVSPTSVPAARKDSWVAQSRNPVSLRLYKVLGSNYEDDATKEALCTLSDLYVTAPSRAINHAQLDLVDGELLLDPDEERIANPHLDSVSVSVLSESVPGESAARARKNLRKDMEAKVAEGSRQFLKALGEVDEVGSFVKYVFTMQ